MRVLLMIAALLISATLTASGAQPAGQRDSDVLQAAGTAVCILEAGERPRGDAVCLDTGLFITTRDALAGVATGQTVRIVARFGSPLQIAADAVVLRQDVESDLALLGAVSDINAEGLKLARGEAVVTGAPLTILDLPIPEPSPLRIGAQAIKPADGKIGRMQMAGGKVSAFAIEADDLPATIGCPVTDAQGRILGIVANVHGRDVSAIPVGRIAQFLAAPAAVPLTPPEHAPRFSERELSFAYASYQNLDSGKSIQVVLDADKPAPRTYPCKQCGGGRSFRILSITAPLCAGPERFSIVAESGGRDVPATVDNGDLRIGDTAVGLDQVKAIFPGEAQLIDGRVLWGVVSGLGSLKAQVQAGETPDLTRSSRIVVNTSVNVAFRIAGGGGGEVRGAISYDPVTDKPQPVPWPRVFQNPPSRAGISRPLPGGGKTTRIDIGTSLQVPHLLWARDGSAFYVLDPGPQPGLLRRIDVAGLVEVAQLPLSGSSMGLSPLGLVVHSGERLWVLDERSLEVRKFLSVGPSSSVITQPGTSRVLLHSRADNSLTWIDLESGRRLRHLTAANYAVAHDVRKSNLSPPELPEFALPPVFAPDGRSLLGVDRGCLFRMTIAGNDLTLAEVGPPLAGQFRWQPVVSPDGKCVAVPGAGLRAKTLGAEAVAIFAIDDLQKPLFAVPRLAGGEPGVAFGRGDNRVYISNAMQTTIYDLATTKAVAGDNAINHVGGPLLFSRNPKWALSGNNLVDLAVAAGPPKPSLVRQEQRLGPVTVADLDLQHTLGMVFSDNGEFVYILENNTARAPESTALRRISLPDLVETDHVAIPPRTPSIARSGQGILVVAGANSRNSSELWVIGEGDLRVRHRIQIDRMTRVISSPALDWAIAELQDHTFFVVNVRDGRVGAQFPLHFDVTKIRGFVAGRVGAVPLVSPQFTSDGKFILDEFDHQIVRYAVHDTNLTPEELSPPVGDIPSHVMVSQDSRYVALPGCTDVIDQSIGPAAKLRGTSIFEVGDLSKPVVTIPEPLSGYVPGTGKVLAHKPNGGFSLCDMNSGVEQSLLPGGTECWATPDGQHAFVAELTGLRYVTLPPARTVAAAPPAPDESLALRVREIAPGVVASVLGVDARIVLPWMEIIDDGKSAFIIQRDGLARRVSLPGLRQEARAELGTECRRMARSALGLLVVANETQRILVLNEQTLAVDKEIRLAGVIGVTSSARLNVAFAMTKEGTCAIDLKTGKIIDPLLNTVFRRVDPKTGSLSPFEMGRVADINVLPDGQRMIVITASNTTALFRIQGSVAVYQPFESGVNIGPTIDVSRDGRIGATWVQKAAGDPNERARIFDLDKPRVPIAEILDDSPSRRMAFDPVSGRMYGLLTNGRLAIYDQRGKMENTFTIDDVPVRPTDKGDPLPRQLVLAPDGRGALALTNRNLLWVTLPAVPPATRPATPP